MSDEAVSNAGDAAPATPSTTLEAVTNAGLHQMAQADDAADYVQEKRDQKAEESGTDISADRKAARADRYRRAVESAQQHVSEKREASAPESATLVHALNEGSGNEQETKEQFEARIREQTKLHTKFSMRAEEYLRKNPNAKADVAVLDYIEPAGHVSHALLNSEYGPAIAHKLALNPDALVELNSMPPMEAVRALGQIEGNLRAEEFYSSQQTQRGGPRRAPNAPAPMSTIRGGASPTADLHALAASDNVDGYVRVRRAQKKDAR